MSETRFHVSAMDCATEKDVIANKLGRLAEVEGMDFDLLDRVVTVRHRDGADTQIEDALREIGMAPQRLVANTAAVVTAAVATRFHIAAMDCATEKDIVANHLGKVAGVQGLDFDLIDRIVSVRHEAGAEARVEDALRAIDMAPRRLDGTSPAATSQVDRPSLAVTIAAWARNAWVLGVAGAVALAAEILAFTVDENAWFVIVMSIVCVVATGPTTFRKGLVALRTFTLNINLLMTIAVAGAIAIGEWPEAAMVTVLFAVAELIESKSVDRARDAIRSLMALTPETARVRRGEAWVEVPAGEVRTGDTVQVLPGDRVPIDGKIVRGTTSIDQAPITGESIPVDRGPGDPVFAGTINQQGSIEIEVTAAQGDTTLARIARTIRAAQGQKAPTERFVDQFARWYTPSVVLLAFGIAVAPPLITGQAFQPWIYKALVLLVIACPCALVISTPVTIVSGLAAAARRGILVKGGVYLEQASKLRMIALDKTGTLTEGKPQLVEAVPMNGITKDDLLRIAASLESTSSHPLAQAVVRGWSGALLPVADASNIVGKGLEGTVGGKAVVVGSHRLAEERGVCNANVERELARLEARGSSVMVVWTGTQVHQILGVLAVADVVRASSVAAVKALHAEGIKLAMLTGDNPTTAKAVGDQVGIDEVDADLLPEDKLATIDRLVKEHGFVGMIGDGVNDAPALARATIGFAMGAAGTDTALETADVALMKDDLRGVPELVELSRRTAKTLKVNIALSIGIKAVFFALALAGIATLWMAVFADLGASLIVAANGLRILRFQPRIAFVTRTIVIALFVAACGDNNSFYSVERLQDPATCMECHPKHYQQWSGSMHAYASDDPVFVAMNNRGQRETNGRLGDFCVKCHAPVAVALGLTDGQNFNPAQLPPQARGITCYFCHNVAEVTSTHNNGLVLANDQTMRGGLKNPVGNSAHRTTYDPLMDSDINESEMCGSCHDIVVPASINGRADIALERTFAEWQTTFFATDKSPGIHLTCGACHMPSSSDVVADAPGLDVPLRANGFHEHMWPAIDQALTPFPETIAQAAGIARDLDPSIAILGPIPLAGPPGPGGICVTPENGGQITVRVDSLGTGHSWPSGAAQDRRTWLELVAHDATNAVIFQTGVVPDGVDPEDIADPNLFGFWDRTFKSDDTPAHFFWDVARVDSQLLLPPVTLDKFDPRFDHSSTKAFSILGQANNVERITARFRVRPLPHALLADLVASGDLDASVAAQLPTLDVGGTVRIWEKATRIVATGCSPQ